MVRLFKNIGIGDLLTRFADVPDCSDVAGVRCPMCTSAELYYISTQTTLQRYYTIHIR